MRSCLSAIVEMLAVSSSLSCARGHVARLRVANVVSNRHLHVRGWIRSPGVCCRQVQSIRTRTETELCCVGARPLCTHLPRDHPPTPPLLCWAATRREHTTLFALHEGSKRYCTGNQVQKPPEQATGDEEASPSAFTPAPPRQGKFQELYENPWTIPNFLCMARIVLSPVLGYLIMEQYFHLSFGLFVLAGATDLLDGYIARNWPNQKSALGSALDPLADKILICVLYISLTYAQIIPVPLTVLVISRDVALIAAVFYVRYKTVPPPVTLSKFFNPCYTTAQLKPTLISKFNTAIQLLLVAASLASPIFQYTDSILLHSLWYVTALTTAASGYSYYHYGRKTVEVLNKTK